MLYLSVSDYWVNWHEIGWGLYQINIPYIWTIGLVKNNTGHCISQLVCVLWLVNLAGYLSLYSLLNSKVCLKLKSSPLFEYRDIINILLTLSLGLYCKLWNLIFLFRLVRKLQYRPWIQVKLKSVTLPPPSPLPTAPFHQVCLGVCQYPFMLLVREKQCRGKFSFSRTWHKDPI